MKIITIKDILKKENHLYYRNDYSGTVVYMSQGGKELKESVEFSVEKDAVGSVEIRINLPANFNYPKIPAVKSLKAYISDIEKQGILL